MDKTYVLSFGNSRKYRLKATPDGADALFKNLSNKIKSYVELTYPQLPAEKYYSRLEVKMVDPMFVADYEVYSSDAITEFKKVIDREVADFESLEQIDSNAPWSNVDADAAPDAPENL